MRFVSSKYKDTNLDDTFIDSNAKLFTKLMVIDLAKIDLFITIVVTDWLGMRSLVSRPS